MSSSVGASTVTQYGFFFDQSRCIGCQACVVACKSWNGISPGPVKWVKIFEYEQGAFPSVRENILWVPCFHCANPVCIPAANGAMYKEPTYGIVFIDPTKATSVDLRAAWEACPYGAIAFDSDAPDATASKCTMCYDRISVGELPECVESCPMRALDFGKLSDLQATYGTSTTLQDLPSGSTTTPSVVFKAKDEKTQLVPYDATSAATLMGERINGLPPIYTNPATLSDLSGVARSSLVIKPASVEQLMQVTKNDDA